MTPLALVVLDASALLTKVVQRYHLPASLLRVSPNRVTTTMASSLTSAQLALLKRLATREAARRQQGSANGVEESVAGPSRVISQQAGTGAAASEDENWQLERMLQEEKTRNDVEWAQVQKVR